MNATRWSSRHTKIAITCAIGAAAAIQSYEHALTVTRWSGTTSWVAYLVPLLPDGLIALSSADLYDSAKDDGDLSPAAITGLVVGIVVTIALNVASGWHHGWGGRLVNSLAPVALIIAVWVLERGLRHAGPAPAGQPAAACDHLLPPAASQQDKAAAVWLHIRDCEQGKPTFRAVGRQLGIHHATAGQLVRHALNGDGPHE